MRLASGYSCGMREMSPRVEEFYNKYHDRHSGKFTSGGSSANANPYAVKRPQPFPKRTEGVKNATGSQAYRPGKDFIHHAGGSYKVHGKDVWRDAGAGLVKATGKEAAGAMKAHNDELARQSRQVVMNDLNKVSANRARKVEEFYNHVHDTATGRFSGRAASGREGFREGSHSWPRIDPTRVVPKRWQGKGDRSTGHGTAKEENFVRGDGRKGPVHVTVRLPKQGKALMVKQAAHRKEAARQIDLRNSRLEKNTGRTTKIPQTRSAVVRKVPRTFVDGLLVSRGGHATAGPKPYLRHTSNTNRKLKRTTVPKAKG